MVYASVAHVLNNFLQEITYRNKRNPSLITITTLTIHFNGTWLTEQCILTSWTLPGILITSKYTKANPTLNQIKNWLQLS